MKRFVRRVGGNKKTAPGGGVARRRLPLGVPSVEALPGGVDAHICRSTSFILISAMALAGFRPLGQVLVQFMMVWQR